MELQELRVGNTHGRCLSPQPTEAKAKRSKDDEKEKKEASLGNKESHHFENGILAKAEIQLHEITHDSVLTAGVWTWTQSNQLRT